MNIIKYPSKAEWGVLLERPHRDASELRETVLTVLDQIRKDGDSAVKAFEAKFDKVQLDVLAVSDEDMAEAEVLVSDDLKEALVFAHANIEKFHASQKFEGEKVETAPGVVCWQKSVPIEKVGLYIPGGTAPLFSTVLMLATPAK
ncbi:MAG: histidinol dehydrogenase, partial [Bacteroidaceae bacterium]|nr:histidinol dehydrogenase [Bacteroidaceae bacterium]